MLRYVQRMEPDERPVGNLPPWLSALLRARGVDTPEKAEAFLHPGLDRLEDPWDMADMDRAAAILRRAAAEGRRVAVYGDYDVDGICAAAIMLETLEDMGIDAFCRLPDRHREGYGLNGNAVRELAQQAPVLLTVDCGITNVEEVRLARRLGMQVIVTDHHQLPETLPGADAVLNPLLGSYPYRRLCGAGVALKITQALLGLEGVKRRLDLAALATVADIVPLTGENRVIVHEGLRAIEATTRPGLQALLSASKVSAPLNAGHIAFRLAPRLNACGRLGSAERGVRLLRAADAETADKLAGELEEANRERQSLETETVREAEALMAQQTDFLTDRLIIVAGEGWNSGVIGLAAGRLCEKYHYPAIVLSVNPERGEAVGSCRSIPGVNIHEALTSCGDLFLRFGGHEMAAGLTIRPERLDEMRRRLNAFVREHCDPACYIPTREYDTELGLEQVDLDLVSSLQALQPTGFCNPAPVFLCRGAQVQEARTVGRDGQHLKLKLLDGRRVLDGIAFGQGAMAARGLDCVDLLYEPDRNEYLGKASAQLQVKSLRPAEGSVLLGDQNKFLSPLLQELCLITKNNNETLPEALPVLTEEALREKLRAVQGTLVLCHHRERAEALARECGADTDMDPRGFTAVVCGADLTGLTDVWRDIVLADGALFAGEAALIREKCPRAALSALKPGKAMRDWLAEILPDREALARLYRQIRLTQPGSLEELAKQAGLPLSRAETGLTVLEELGHIRFEREPFQVRLCPKAINPLENSRILRLMREAVENCG